MHDIQIIEQLISTGAIGEAIEMLSENIGEDPQNALWPYLRGKLKWKQGEQGAAITDYENAIALDPNSPAKHALDMSRDILNYFNPDMFNP